MECCGKRASLRKLLVLEARFMITWPAVLAAGTREPTTKSPPPPWNRQPKTIADESDQPR